MQYKKKSQEWLPNGVASSCLLVVYHQMIVHAFLTVLIRQRSYIAPVMDPIHYVTVEVEAIDQFAQVWFSSITHKYITSYRPTSIRKLSSCCFHLRILRHQVMLMNIKNINLSNIAHRHTHTLSHPHTQNAMKCQGSHFSHLCMQGQLQYSIRPCCDRHNEAAQCLALSFTAVSLAQKAAAIKWPD